MAKKKYVKPMMVSEAFVPNEYVAACAWEPGTELTATCVGNKITIRLETYQGNNVWSATPIDEDGNTAGGTEMLYPIKDTKDYAFCGAIYDEHEGSAVSGEFYPVSSAGGTAVAGSVNSHGWYCDDILEGQSGAGVGSWHHHLTNVKNKNAS